jgi:hypothetical protein
MAHGNRHRLSAFAAAAGLLLSAKVSATAIAESSISFSHLQILPTSGSVQILSPWAVESFAQAQNSLGEFDDDDQIASPGGAAAADAAVTWAMGHGDGSATNPPDLDVAAAASSTVNLPGCEPKAAQSQGRGSLGWADPLGGVFANTFQITGGTGSVTVDFSAALAGNLHVFTDGCGLLARTEVIFGLQVFKLPTANGPSDPLVLFSDRLLLIGPNDNANLPFADTLSQSALLDYDTPYGLFIEVDSESQAVVPEPATATLFLAGVGLWPEFRRRKDSKKR